MGFYVRKAAKVGPFRLNLSKSGLGVSAGVRGFRVSGGRRGALVHMGRHGIYYRKSLSKSSRSGKRGHTHHRRSSLVPGGFPR